MNAKKILFPTDFSSLSDAGLEHAAALARESGARLLIVHVEEPPIAYGGGEMYYGALEPNVEALRTMLRAVVPKDPSVAFEHRLVSGAPADEIVRLAKHEHVDLIVMATHGRTGLRHLLMGSVAEAVVRRAHCPVMIFKPSAAEPSATEARSQSGAVQ